MTRVPSSLRKQVRQRAGQRCEYCRIPEVYTSFPFQADHIISLKHDGPTTYENLVWACFWCNNRKGSDVAAYDDITNQLAPLFNPRLQLWDDHFDVDEGAIIGKTPIGRATARLLKMNHHSQVEIRLDLINKGLW